MIEKEFDEEMRMNPHERTATKIRIAEKIICDHCKDEIYLCDGCANYLEHDPIFCEEVKHYCEECKDET